MELTTFILAIVALLLTVIVPLAIERWKRPKLEITAATWPTPGPVNRTFAVARVRSKPLRVPFLRRDVAQGCEIELDFRCADKERKFLPIKGRWSSHQEPISTSLAGGVRPIVGPPVTGAPAPYNGGSITPGQYGAGTGAATPSSGGTASTSSYPGGSSIQPFGGNPGMDYISRYDPSLDPPQQDIGVSRDGEEVAVAILRDGKAYAFSTQSYNYPDFGNPDWGLPQGTYYIDISIQGSNVKKKSKRFKLEYLDDNNFAAFRLKEPDES